MDGSLYVYGCKRAVGGKFGGFVYTRTPIYAYVCVCANIWMGGGIKFGLYGIIFLWVVVYTSMGTNVQWWADLVVKKRNVAYSHELATFRLVIIRK